MKHFVWIFCFLLKTTLWCGGNFEVEVHAPAAILMNASTGAILFEKNAHEIRYPASTTKIATAIFALGKNRDFLDSEVIAEQDSIGTVTEEQKKRTNYQGPAYRLIVGGTHIMIKNGESLPLRALFYGMMLESANDAANVIAQYTSGKIDRFMKDLNQYLIEIGCKNTRFLNPSGLHHPDHKTSAYDLAIMAKQGLKDPLFREIVKTVKYVRPKTNKQNEMPMVQHNRLLKRGSLYYESAIGVKTGYHSLAGYNLVAAAERNGRVLIAVSMGCKNRNEPYEDAILLFNEAFNEKKLKKTLLSQGEQKILIPIEAGQRTVKTYTKEPLIMEFYPSEKPKVNSQVFSHQPSLPIHRGDVIGEITFTDQEGKLIYTAPLYAAEDLEETIFCKTCSLFQNFSKMRYAAFFLVLCICFCSLLYLLFYR